MNLKISIFITSLCLAFPVAGWSQSTATTEVKGNFGEKEIYLQNEEKKLEVLEITKSTLNTANWNSIGIIANEITGIDAKIWSKMGEENLAIKLKELPYQNFYASRTFLKRILISELDPPINASTTRLSGQFYLLAKIDKLIDMGALDEAETIITQVPEMSKEIFIRWAKVSLLTGRVTRMCKNLVKSPQLTSNISLRVICFARVNDWDAAALILASSAALNLIDENREVLLTRYLDPLTNSDNGAFDFPIDTDEIDFHIKETNKISGWNANNEPRYNFITIKDDSNPAQQILSAEILVRNKSINGSTLFDLYRTSKLSWAKNIWPRLIAIRNLDLALGRTNSLAIGVALSTAIKEMRAVDLLAPFASEYAPKLSGIPINMQRGDFNDAFAMLFAAYGEIPRQWANYTAANKYVKMAFNINQDIKIDSKLISKSVKLLMPPIKQKGISETSSLKHNREQKHNFKSKGEIILTALTLTSDGVNTSYEDISTALNELVEIYEIELVKSILTENLLHYFKP